MKRMTALTLVLLLSLLCVANPCGLAARTEAKDEAVRLLMEAAYPETPQYPTHFDAVMIPDAMYSDPAYQAWSEAAGTRVRPDLFEEGLPSFFPRFTAAALSQKPGQNTLCSPVNVYLTLGMLSEITAGNTRAQIMQLLDADDQALLRQQMNDAWNSCYIDDGVTASVLGASLWLSDTLPYHPDVVQLLAERYYASAYQGDLSDPAATRALQKWLNEQTGGLLEEQSSQIAFTPDTLLALAATVYFRAKWDNTFSAELTAPDVFHAPDGDITCDFMHDSGTDTFYTAPGFTAVCRSMKNGGVMWFLLPDEGLTPADLLQNDAALSLLCGDASAMEGRRVILNVSIPKFDCTSQTELSRCLQKLGMKDAFTMQDADFSALTPAPAYISRVQHDVRVRIDEEGCEGAAYTVMLMVGAAMPPPEVVDFVLDRPFLFCVTSSQTYEFPGLPLFVGVVNQP